MSDALTEVRDGILIITINRPDKLNALNRRTLLEIEEAMAMVKDLRENHSIFCSIVVYPVIPKGMIILRLIPTAVHSQEDIDQTLDAFEKVSHKLKSGQYRPAVNAAV